MSNRHTDPQQPTQTILSEWLLIIAEFHWLLGPPPEIRCFANIGNLSAMRV
jgi:hypothetical protein